MKRLFHFGVTIIIATLLTLNTSPLAAYSVSTSGTGPDDDTPTGGSIVGTVTEEDSNEPMEYSTIAVYSAKDSSLVGGTVSDANGKFVVKQLPFGEYYVETNFIGYDKHVVDPIRISSDNRNVDLGILKLSVSHQVINEVEVIGDRKHVEYKLDKKVVSVSQDLNAAGGSAVDVLENTPSVAVDIDGNVTLRGSGSFTVLIDGKPTVLEGSDALRQIPATAIENIEIITNPSAKYDPDGNAGIINIIMKEAIERGTTGIINASAGRNDKYRADFLLNRKQQNWNFFLGGNYNNFPRLGSLTREQVTYGDSVDSYIDADGNLDFKFAGGQLKTGLSYDFSKNTTLTFEANAGIRSFQIDRSNKSHEYTVPSSEEIYYVSNSVMDREGKYYELNANFSHNFGGKDHKIVAMANFSQQTGKGEDLQEDYNTGEDFRMEDVVPESARQVENSQEIEGRFQVDYTRPVGNTGKLEAGYQLRYRDEFEDNVYENYDPGNGEWINDPLYTSGLYFLRSINSVYATFGGETGSGFQYMVGLRGEHTYRNIRHEITDTYVINRLDYYPTVHLAKKFGNDNQLMLSYSKRVDRPRGWNLEPNVRYVDPYTIMYGNPNLQPEYIHSFEMGYQKGWGMNFMALELYYRNTQNLNTMITNYDEDQELFIITRENLNADHSAGAELMLNWKFWNKLTMNGSVTPYFYAISGTINDEAIDSHSFNWRSNLNTTYQITPTTRVQLNQSYRSKSVSAQGYSTGFYYMNLALRQDLFDRKLSATLQVRDVLGTSKRESYNYGSNFEQHMLRTREAQVVMLTFSYRLNNYKMDERNRGERGGNEGGGGGDSGGGMDLGM